VKVVVATEALADLQRLATFLAEKDERAAERAFGTLTKAIDSLISFPERGRRAGIPSFRELVVPFGRSAYVVRYVYRASSKTVLVVRIWHSREKRD
jgi:plasmid stabilization system protein ParE